MVTLFSGENYEKKDFRVIFGPSKFQKWHFLRFVVDWWVWKWPTHQSYYDNPFGIFGNLISKCACMSEILTPSIVSGMSHRQRTKLKLFINSRGSSCRIPDTVCWDNKLSLNCTWQYFTKGYQIYITWKYIIMSKHLKEEYCQHY